MNIVVALIAFLLAILLALIGATRVGSWLIERRNPPVGAFAEIDGALLHFVHVPGPANPQLPPLVFIHGASGNLQDQMIPLRPLLEGKAEMLFLDRPGHGWSARGASNETPSGQAASIVALMHRVGIQKAIIVGHSFGGAIAATLAVEHPEAVGGLLFLSPATHPWPGRETSWYYKLTAVPVFGRIFSETLAQPGARLRIEAATACVFAPNAVPSRYLGDASIELLLRPAAFRANAIDVEGLYRHVEAMAPRYASITAPTIVVTGDRDTVVYEEIHSEGLARDIPGAQLVWVHNLGHKPDWVTPELVVAAVEQLAGLETDVQAVARAAEARIAADAYGPPEACPDEKPGSLPMPAESGG